VTGVNEKEAFKEGQGRGGWGEPVGGGKQGRTRDVQPGWQRTDVHGKEGLFDVFWRARGGFFRIWMETIRILRDPHQCIRKVSDKISEIIKVSNWGGNRAVGAKFSTAE